MQTIERAGNTLAFHATQGQGPGVVFLGGFKSDMEGTKAIALEVWARQQGLSLIHI